MKPETVSFNTLEKAKTYKREATLIGRMFTSKLVKSYEATLAIFLRLNLPIGIHQRIAELEGISAPTELRPTISLAPGVRLSIGKPPTIARIGNTRIEYQEDRFILRIVGPIEELAEALEKIADLYNKYHYDVNKIVRYYELDFPPQPIDIEGGVILLRKNIKTPIAESLSKVFGWNLQPFTISLTYPETPLTDEWFSVTIEPEVNAPRNRLLIRIIKRESDFSRMRDFLRDLPQKLNKLAVILAGSEDR